jgi:ATP-dependent DNA helicase RecQ
MAVQPTGSGKSLCYQLPALLMPGLVLVVSALTAHVRDAVTRLPCSVPAGICLGGDFKRASTVRFLSVPCR